MIDYKKLTKDEVAASSQSDQNTRLNMKEVKKLWSDSKGYHFSSRYFDQRNKVFCFKGIVGEL